MAWAEWSRCVCQTHYGIYFSFNRADIRPVSKRVLDEIAAAFKTALVSQ